MRYLKLLLCVIATAVVVWLLNHHVEGVNGPSYYQWIWQQLAWPRVLVGFAVAIVPFALGHALVSFGRWPQRRALKAVALSLFLLQLVAAGLREDPFSLEVGAHVIQHPVATSYFTDAVALDAKKDFSLSKWVSDYPKAMSQLGFRSKTKPPGPILFHLAIVRLYKGHPEAAATVAALLIALLTSLGVFAVRWFIAVMTGDPERGFWGASLFALMPGIVIIHPMFDQLYPIVTCAMVGLWAIALKERRKLAALACGMVIAASTFFIFTLLTLGILLVALTVMLWLWDAEQGRTRNLLTQLGWALAGLLLIYAALWLTMHYDPIATFRSAWQGEEHFKSWVAKRTYPQSIYWDLEDFALGMGWVAPLLLLFGLLRAQPRQERAIAIAGFLQVVTVAVTALLAGETARLFMFMVPLVLIPMDRELAARGPWARTLVFACALAVLIAVRRNLIFIGI
ncbi:MAG: hypothetical protein HY901_16485 [Deltaproteobacteria bacterium]|nr:hypothetical protein [Deltaproteobacteria bacterium]